MHTHSRAVAQQLVSRFCRQKPLRGGSLLVTLFGDSILPRGGAIALGSLIRLAAPFGLNERLVRTAAARLAQDGWLAARRAGKLSEYRLTASGRERFAEATIRIYAGPTAAWSGRWMLVVLPALGAAQRQRWRRELAWQGFGEVASGVLARPEGNSQSALEAGAPTLPAHALVFDARLADDLAPQALVKLGWDLGDLAKRYGRFVERFERVRDTLQSPIVEPNVAFSLRTLLIHEYRRLHLRDPLLPDRLLPAHWPGTRAATLCREIYIRVFAPSEVHLSTVAARLHGALPPPDETVLQRFGGLGAP